MAMTDNVTAYSKGRENWSVTSKIIAVFYL